MAGAAGADLLGPARCSSGDSRIKKGFCSDYSASFLGFCAESGRNSAIRILRQDSEFFWQNPEVRNPAKYNCLRFSGFWILPSESGNYSAAESFPDSALGFWIFFAESGWNSAVRISAFPEFWILDSEVKIPVTRSDEGDEPVTLP